MPGIQPAVEIAIWRAPSPNASGPLIVRIADEHVVVVVEGLAHAHHHDVRDACVLLVAQQAGEPQQLLADLLGLEVAPEPHAAGGAERARERAARLRREADGAALAVAHRDGLERVAVVRAQLQLDRAVLGALRGLLAERAQRRVALEALAQRPRQRRDLVPALGELRVDGVRELPGAVRGCALLLEHVEGGLQRHGAGAAASSSRPSGAGTPSATRPAVDRSAARDGENGRGVETRGGRDVGGSELATPRRRAARLGGDGGERVAVTLPGLQVVIRRHGPLAGRVDLEVQVRRPARASPVLPDEADDVARVDVGVDLAIGEYAERCA